MARPSKVVSPEKQPTDDSEEDGVNAEDWEPEHSDVDLASDGKTLHLGSDLPDIPPESEEAQTPLAESAKRVRIAKMGNTTSKEEINEAVKATSDELLQRQNARQRQPNRASTGKLKRPSSSAKNPMSSSPTTTMMATQRKLGPSNIPQQSMWEVGDDSPEKLPPPKLHWTEKRPQFSPRRAARKRAQKPSVQLVPLPSHLAIDAQQEDMISPRRSTRKQGLQEPEASAETKTPKRKRLPKAAQPETEAEAGVEDTTYKDFFRDQVVKQHQDDDTGAGAVNKEEEEDNIRVADHSEEAAQAQIVTDTAPQRIQPKQKKRGRPKKSSASPEESPKEKKKLGRPKKSDVLPAEAPQPVEDAKPARRSQRQSVGQNDVDTNEADSGQAAPKTRGQRAPPSSPQNAKPVRKSTGAVDALHDLRRRKSQVEPEDDDQSAENEDKAEDASQLAENEDEGKAADVDAEAGDLDEIMQREDDEEDLPERPVVDVRPIYVHAEELGFSALSEDDNDDEGNEANQRLQLTSNSRKRKASNQPAKANTTAKRAKFVTSEVQDGDEEPSTSNGPHKHRLCGQWYALRQVFRNISNIGCSVRKGKEQEQPRLSLDDEDVKATVELCKKAMALFTKLKNDSGQVDPDHHPVDVLLQISKRVDGLCDANDEFPTDLKDSNKSLDIYFHLFPRLVRLVMSAVSCYESIDAGEVPEGQITIAHFRIVNDMISVILELAKAAKKYSRPDSSYSVVQPVHSGIEIPLRAIHQAFSRHIQHHELKLREKKRREEEAKDRALQLEQEERRLRQQANIRRLRTKWNKLHEERMWAEGGIMGWRKREHLQLPDRHIETDQNGILFERTEVFLPRVGPPPGLVDKAAAREWSMLELSALCDGLKQYAGPHVFERVFRKYCGQGRELNKYNVTEIVTTAAGLRERLIEDQNMRFGDVEDWILGIPVWTKGHQAALGKENEDVVGDGGGVVDLTAES